MTQNLLEMKYNELTQLLESLLEAAQVPVMLTFRDKKINYKKQGNFSASVKVLYLYWRARRCWNKYIKKYIKRLKIENSTYNALYTGGCIRDLRITLYLSRIGIASLCERFRGTYNEKLGAYFALATMLYDASLDVPYCHRYLQSFDDLIMKQKQIDANDEYLRIFKEVTTFISNNLEALHYDELMKYVKILHVIQLLGSERFASMDLSKEYLLKLTFAKGGISFLAMLSLFSCTMNDEQRKAVYSFGACSQLMDDLLDSNIDRKVQLKTIPNQNLMNKNEIKELFFGSVNNLICATGMDPNRPHPMLEILYRVSDQIDKKTNKK